MTRAGGCSSGLFPKIRRLVRLPRSLPAGRPVRGQGDDGAGRTLRGKGSFALVSLSRQKQVGAAIPGATFRFPQKFPGVPVSGAGFAFSEGACAMTPVPVSRSLSEAQRRRAERSPCRDCSFAAKGRALRLPRVAGSLRFFVRRFARRRSSAQACAFVRGAGAEGRFSESAASCGVCAFSRAAGGPAYSKPRLRR